MCVKLVMWFAMYILHSISEYVCGYRVCDVLLGCPWAGRCVIYCCCAMLGLNLMCNSLPVIACYQLMRAMSRANDTL